MFAFARQAANSNAQMKTKLALVLAIMCCCGIRVYTQEVVRLKFKLNTDGTLVSLAFSPDAKLVAATYGMDTTARIWEASTGVVKRTHVGRPISYDQPGLEGRSYITFSPDGRIVLAIAREAREIRMWENETGKQYMTIANLITMSEATFSPDGRLLALAAGWHGLQVIDVGTRKVMNTPWETKNVSNAWTARFTQDGSTLLTSMEGNENNSGYYSFDVQTGKLKTAIATPKDKRTRWTMSTDGCLLLGIDEKNVITLWNALSGRSMTRIGPINGQIGRLSVSPDNKQLAIINGKVIKIYDVDSGEFKLDLADLVSENAIAVFSPDGTTLIAQDKEGLKIWDTSTGLLQQTLSEARWPVRFSSDGKFLLTASKNRNALLWEVQTKVRK
jgi:WD40 repeat protein